jgi:hypothetical protein
MFNAIIAFFSSFNPIVFGAVLAAGAVIVVRKPGRAVALRSTGNRQGTGKAPWRHQA